MRNCLIFTLLLITVFAKAQNNASIRGRVVDSVGRLPVEMATVYVLNARDTTFSAMINYVQTNEDGLFEMRNLPTGKPLKVVISFVGYRSMTRFFTPVKGQTLNMGQVLLAPRQLNEVVIHAERMPFVVKKDTVEFDAAAFKVRPNAVVEDLLKKLPGVEVDNDGKIMAMGKPVTKILIDGKEFFANSIVIASRNLDADLIDKIQVYDDRENDPNHLVPEAQVNKIINLKFKKALKKSVFGKLYAGQGTNSHYQAGGLFNMFRDTLQVSALGLTNNLNSTGFDYNDLQKSGGLNRGGGAAFSQQFAPYGFVGAGKQTTTTAGVNINTDYGKKLKINLSYLLSHKINLVNSTTNRQQFLNDTTVATTSASNRDDGAYNHEVSGLVAWKPNDSTELRYTPSLNILQSTAGNHYAGNSYSNYVNPINQSVSNSNSSSYNLQFKQDMFYNHQYKKDGPTLTINHSLQINPGNSSRFNNQDLTSYLSTFPSYSFQQLADGRNKNVYGSLAVEYRYPVSKKFVLDAGLSSEYSDGLNLLSTYNYDSLTNAYDSFLLEKSHDLDRSKWTEGISPGFSYDFAKDSRLTFHGNTQWQQVANNFNRSVPNIDKKYFFFLPVVEVVFKNWVIDYNRSMQLPNISDMIPYTIVYNPQYSETGNPNLTPTESNTISFNRYSYNYQKGISFGLNGSAEFERNSIIRRRTLDAQLVQTSAPVNYQGKNYYQLGFNANKRFKKTKDFQLSISSYARLSTSNSFFILNNQEGLQRTYIATFSMRSSLNWKDVVMVDPQYSLYQVYTVYSNVDYANRNYLTHSLNAHFNVIWPRHMDIEGKYDYRYNPQVPDGFQKSSNLLTLGIARRFLKKERAEIKLSCYDVFNQNIGVSRNINENIIADTQTEIIKRYFMLTLQFKFNKATTAK